MQTVRFGGIWVLGWFSALNAHIAVGPEERNVVLARSLHLHGPYQKVLYIYVHICSYVEKFIHRTPWEIWNENRYRGEEQSRA